MKLRLRSAIHCLLTVMICLAMITGCSGGSSSPSGGVAASKDNKTQNAGTQDDGKQNVTTQNEDKQEEAVPANEDIQSNDKTEEEAPVNAPEKGSLAERMRGKYSCKVINDEGVEETYIMDVVNFGDNLYAYCGVVMLEDSESLSAYSFWASEFIPLDADEIKSAEGDSVDVNEFSFSVMSNAGEYADTGHFGTITLTDEGLVLDGFEYGESRLYVRDDRVEDAFRYLKDESVEIAGELQGIWVQDTGDAPFYAEFAGSNLYLYRKEHSKEVFFAAGGCEHRDGAFDFIGNQIQNGGMPLELTFEYGFEGDQLVLKPQGYDIPDLMPEELRLVRSEEPVETVTMDQVVLDEDSFGEIGAEYSAPFYGLWLDAFKEETDAASLTEELTDKGLPAAYVYSCDWENLNKEPYYCVTIGKYGSKEAAEAFVEEAEKEGYGSAYVKYTGVKTGHTAYYSVFDESGIRIGKDKVLIPADTVKDFYLDGQEEYNMKNTVLYVDHETVFDESCDTDTFGYYREGDSPLAWFNRINEIRDTEEYMTPGAMAGIFRVEINGNHIERYYGSYWYD